jgi:hypothetical protein
MTAPTKTIRLDDDVSAVLSRATFTGLDDGTPLTLRLADSDAGLPRDLYVRVNKAIVALGGKWNRYSKGHVWEDDAVDAADRLADALAEGGIVIEKLGWFPTPPLLVDRLIELAEIEPHHLVLEPSAGRGAILGRLADLVDGERLYAVEIDLVRYRHLCQTIEGITVMLGDFLRIDWIPELAGGFDRIVMNPPFENGQAWQHVERAYNLLAPGGRLVSIMPGTYRELLALRLKMPYADVIWRETNPEGAFKESGTAVRTITVKLDRYR